MGGTSTDVSLCEGEIKVTHENEVNGMPVGIPMMDIHTVGAGGGSIAELDPGGALKVGPESAGADPGPICYGKGERLTVTDANVILGRLLPEFFLGGTMKLAADRIPQALQKSGWLRHWKNAPELAHGIIDVVNNNMEQAIRLISVERGYDPRDFTLFCFGGAGGLHAASLAQALGMKRVVVPRFPGALSALGLLLADVRKDYSRTLLIDAGVSSQKLKEASTRIAQARRVGVAGRRFQETGDPGAGFRRFALPRTIVRTHSSSRFGSRGSVPQSARAPLWLCKSGPGSGTGQREDRLHRPDVEAGFRQSFKGAAESGTNGRAADMAGGQTDQNAYLQSRETGTRSRHRGPGDRRRVQFDDAGAGRLPLRRGSVFESGAGDMTINPVQLEIFKSLFHAIAEEMGATLKRTAFSPNIKERRDYSCAIFDSRGDMVAQGDHMPVHLGSMPLSVKAAIESRPIGPGDAIMLNDPYKGGTHLPDITLVSGVFSKKKLLFLRRLPRAPVRHRWYVSGFHAAGGGDLSGRSAHPPRYFDVERQNQCGRMGHGSGQRAHAIRT